MIWKTIFGLPLLTVLPLQALVERKIDEKTPLEVIFSRTSHNRISIENGSVERIFGDGTIFSVSLDKTTGNGFINVLQNIDVHPVTLTVVSNGGLIQDLIVTSREGPSEQVILKEEEDPDFCDVNNGNPEVYQAVTIDLLNKILEGKTPIGYGKRDTQVEDLIDLPSPLKASQIKAFEGVFETIVVYAIKNEGRQPVIVSAETLKNDKNSWVFLNSQQLKKNEQAICVISYPKK